MKSKFILWLALALSGSTVAAFSQINDASGMTPQGVAKKVLDAYAALSSYSDTGKTIESNAGQTNVTTFSIRMQRPKLFKMRWVRTSGNQTNEGIWWADGHPGFSPENTYLLTNTVGQPSNSRPAIVWIPFAMTEVGRATGQATIVPDVFLKLDPSRGNFFTRLAADGSKAELGDGKIGEVDCYIISISTKAVNGPGNFRFDQNTTRLWIGRKDFLLRQIQATSETSKAAVTQTHENISVNQKFEASDFEEQLPQDSSSVSFHSAPPVGPSRK